MAEDHDLATPAPTAIVVGIDDSEAARHVLAYAIEEAARRQASLRVVTAFESAGRFGARYGVSIPVSDDEIAERETVAARKIVDEVLASAATQPDVEVIALSGPTGPVLVEQSRHAQLLVVGHRGHGELASVLIGSVGLYCVLHAHTPVLVVRSDG